MAAYLLMIALPGIGAVLRARATGAFFLLLFLVYWLLIGFRYQVGMDWDNYIRLHQDLYVRPNIQLADVLGRREPGFALLSWFAAKVWGGMILVNATSALVFCVGFFAYARRCPEPFIALVTATPLLVVAHAMSGVRQTLAMGIVFALFATWERRTAVGRVGFVLLASLFHFSAVFVLVFVALAARVGNLVKSMAVGGAFLAIALAIYVDPTSVEAYSELYVAGQRKVEAPGAVAHVGVVASAALLYLLNRRRWVYVNGEQPLLTHLAVAALLSVPLVIVSSVGAYRFALYLWPVAMYVWASAPRMIAGAQARVLYRGFAVLVSAILLYGWLTYANSARAWLPYKNWLLQPEDAVLLRGRVN